MVDSSSADDALIFVTNESISFNCLASCVGSALFSISLELDRKMCCIRDTNVFSLSVPLHDAHKVPSNDIGSWRLTSVLLLFFSKAELKSSSLLFS